MVCWQTLLLACATFGQAPASDGVLLSFSSPYCGPCQQMAPVVAQMQQAGYRIQKIDVTRQQELARQYRVEGVPCFVMVAGGREVERAIGPQSAERLQGMFRQANRATPPVAKGGGDVVRGQSPTHEVGTDALRAAERNALAATVRIKVDDPQGNSYGTGTIVDQHEANALILTCGHIFRDSQGKGQITIDLFQGGQPLSVPGHLIDYDLERDVALIAMRPGVAVQSVSIAGEGFRAVRGAAAFSVGCDRGAEPTVRRSRIVDINRYQGKPNIEAAGMPVVGRSGGGLFTADGTLIGVCNFADEEANEGIYAAPKAFQAHFDQAGLASVYKKSPQRGTEEYAVVTPPTDDPRPAARQQGDVIAPTKFDYAGGSRPLRAIPQPAGNPPGTHNVALPAYASDAEVVCIVRSRTGEQRTVVLPRASQALIDHIGREEASQRMDIARQQSQGPVIRAQSGDRR